MSAAFGFRSRDLTAVLILKDFSAVEFSVVAYAIERGEGLTLTDSTTSRHVWTIR